MEERDDTDALARANALEHLTGPSRGKVTWLSGSAMDVSVGPTRVIHVAETMPAEPSDTLVARLHRSDSGYEIEAVAGRDLWVNGARIAMRQLQHLDMIEFGKTGPLSRYCQYLDDRPVRRTLSDIVSDAFAYLRVSRQPLANRITRALGAVLRRLARETTILFRLGVILALVALAGLAYQQYRVNVLLQAQIESSADRLESFARAMARAREEALTPGDLEALRQELEHGLSSNVDRLEELERRSEASARVIADTLSSVLFLQGAYGFRETASGRLLRYAVDEEGLPLVAPTGQPLLTLEGEGPVAERQFIGTGFPVGDKGALITNRHLALPWENDANVEAFAGQGYEPAMIKFIAYLPGEASPRAVELLLVGEAADLAILRWGEETEAVPGLKLAETLPAAGDEVIVMGYPTGLRAILAQAGAAFIEELQATNNTGFWSVAERLAEEGHIAPLASRGIVGHVTGVTVVYDADTTHGGSGGPVLNVNGEVVAVNAAILPEYGGSNLGVPVAHVRALLEAAGLQ